MTISFYADYDDAFDLTVCLGNAMPLFDLLNVRADFCGRVPSLDLLARIHSARGTLDSCGCGFARPASIAVGEHGAVIVDNGLSTDRIGWYLDRLEQVAGDALKRGIEFVTWS